MAFTGVVLVLLVVGQVVYYFYPHLNAYNRQLRPHYDHQDAGFRARGLPEETHLYLLTNDTVYIPHFGGMAAYWQRPLRMNVVGDPQSWLNLMDVQAALDAGDPLAFFVNPEDTRVIAWLDDLYGLPAPQFSPYSVPPDRQYVLYYFPPRGG